MSALQLAFSPCPNDTFIFYALANRLLDTGDHCFDITLADVEELNSRAMKGEADVIKVSVGAYAGFADEYILLPCGGALGRGCGPLVVRKAETDDAKAAAGPIAIPGRMTTANLVLHLTEHFSGERVEMRYDKIMDTVMDDMVDAAVLIHESRFLYAQHGLELILDLGKWWEDKYNLPLPLGAIAVRRSLGQDFALWMAEKIRESLSHARLNFGAAWPYIAEHAQEMEQGVIRSHIEMFVNEYSMDVGKDGRKAIATLLNAAFDVGGYDRPAGELIA